MSDELVGQLPVVEKRTPIVAGAFPTTELNLVHGDRLVESLMFGSRADPFTVVPGKMGDVPHDRGRLGP